MASQFGDHNSNKDLTAGAAAYDEWYQTLSWEERQAADKAVRNAEKLPNTGPVQAKYLVVKTLLMVDSGRIR